MGTEDDVKVAADPNLLERTKKSEHGSKVLLAEQRSSEQHPSQELNEEELKRQERILKIFEQQDKMDYLKYEEMMEQGGDVIELTDDHRIGEGSPRAFHACGGIRGVRESRTSVRTRSWNWRLRGFRCFVRK